MPHRAGVPCRSSVCPGTGGWLCRATQVFRQSAIIHLVSLRAKRRIIAQNGEKAIIFELQDPFFWYHLRALLNPEPEIQKRDYIILDLRLSSQLISPSTHVYTGADMLVERDAFLLLSNVKEKLLTAGIYMIFRANRIYRQRKRAAFSLESAIEWVEERLIGTDFVPIDKEFPLQLQEMELFQGSKTETLVDLEDVWSNDLSRLETIYAVGDQGHKFISSAVVKSE